MSSIYPVIPARLRRKPESMRFVEDVPTPDAGRIRLRRTAVAGMTKSRHCDDTAPQANSFGLMGIFRSP